MNIVPKLYRGKGLLDISVYVCVEWWGRDASHVVTLLFKVFLHVCTKRISPAVEENSLWRVYVCVCVCERAH